MIDYYYVRMYINSLAIQALVERTTSRGISDAWPGVDFLRNEYAQDYKFNNEVRTAACAILSITIKLGESGDLRFCPVRVFLRIVSASIFLLKSISVGTRTSDLYLSLDILDKCNQILKETRHDDIHLSARYGTLIERHVRRFRRNFRVQSGLNASKMGIATNAGQGVQYTTAEAGDASAFVPMVPSYQNSEAQEMFNIDAHANIDDFLAQPFDPSLAPFALDQGQSGSVLNMESLDFLWNLPM